MPLQNRVTPFGELVADPARGLVYGNRGCLHDADGHVHRGWATRRWIACRLRFRGWHRHPLLQPGKFTELFFLDDATALAAGHRPCALCRRADYVRLCALWQRLHPAQRGADAIDLELHGQRLDGRRRRLHRASLQTLPDGAFVVTADVPQLVLGAALRPWTAAGYGPPTRRPRGPARLLTPPSLVELLRDRRPPLVPLFHPSATETIDREEHP